MAARTADPASSRTARLLRAGRSKVAKKLVEEGAVGKLYMVKQGEKHSGPHSDWFYDVRRSGGGAIMDMGCHGIEWAR